MSTKTILDGKEPTIEELQDFLNSIIESCTTQAHDTEPQLNAV